ncbi:MAG: hypothetical protein KJ048_09645, partial [Dehalococcoidia bacterium]|nr:hypothetical protein [Dehalococcoidia bacterium]
VVVLAALVRWANAGTPDLAPYRSVVEADDQRKAAVLAALLGTARAIRRRQPSPVLDVSARLNKERLTVRLHGQADLEAELYELERQQRRLETVLKVAVSFVVRAQPPA